jgi:hypothetical protein
MRKCANCSENAADGPLCHVCSFEYWQAEEDRKRFDHVEKQGFIHAGDVSINIEDDWRAAVYARSSLQRPYRVFPKASFTWKHITRFVHNRIKLVSPEHYEFGLWPIEFRCAYAELKIALDRAMLDLTERERLVLCMRFGIGEDHEYELADIGMGLGVCRERVRGIESQALRKLRNPKRSHALREFLSSFDFA